MSLPPSDLSARPQELLEQLSRAVAELTSLQRQLAESQRLAAIGTIAAVIAHEFNNLLTPIVSYSQYALQSLEKGQPDLELIRKALVKSFQSSSKAGRICASMLALARGESTASPVEVQQLIDETLLVLARDPRKDGIALRVQVQPGLKVVGDAVQLEQVLLNLLINARQAMLGKGGVLTIKARRAEAMAHIQVSDTGPGIPESLLPRIFEPFFTTKANVGSGEPGGTGLGLAICRQIIEHHGGRIQVQSRVGEGTTFSLFLPAAEEVNPSPAPRAAPRSC
ncbi:MAG: ATP-binding protein [Phycisphaerae bacterium]|nr:ATP-binding protein [Phycisphaerae bacterium]MDW8261748.1 ATP-binding protein [Phycisphaerales bacterium]